MEKELKDCRIIGFRRSNEGRTSNVYMISECNYCHAILEFPSNEVSTEIYGKERYYREFINCPNCNNKVVVVNSGKE